ncbi:MAG: cytidine/deoxycytidylate deaminase family protein [Alphaproteobacteria bacterium]|nr:cytidine/deoxycytidylate deaminase family protein [Alphaproteobacteria bacterium]
MSDKYIRPTWDEYFFEVVEAVSKRGSCDRGRTGCVIVKDKQILSTGYVGAPSGLPDCSEAGHLLKKVTHEDGKTTQHCMRTVHAEQNAICQAAKKGIALEGSTMYCKLAPCRACAMMIIQVGIKKVYAAKAYHAGSEAIEMLKSAGVEFKVLDDTVQKYDNQ